MSVLLLNADYRPLNILSRRRALSLWMQERALPATGDMLEMHSPRVVAEIPHVLVLKRYINVPQRGAKWSKRGVYMRDAWTCAYCGAKVDAYRDGRVLKRAYFSVDHIIPKAQGGQNTWGNTVCACQSCNRRKGNRTPHQAGMKLLWEPKTPRTSYLVARGNVPASWKVYLEVD